MAERRKIEAPILGVREWGVDEDGTLLSIGVGGEWRPREVQVAECKTSAGWGPSSFRMNAHGQIVYHRREPEEAHESPHKGCGCGLYAFYNHETCKENGDGIEGGGIRGVVSAWGRVIRCEYGIKAEKMRLEALICERESMRYMGANVGIKGAQRDLAHRHGVPLITPEEIPAFVGLHGGVVMEADPQPIRFLPEGWTASSGRIPPNVVFGHINPGSIPSQNIVPLKRYPLPPPYPSKIDEPEPPKTRPALRIPELLTLACVLATLGVVVSWITS